MFFMASNWPGLVGRSQTETNSKEKLIQERKKTIAGDTPQKKNKKKCWSRYGEGAFGISWWGKKMPSHTGQTKGSFMGLKTAHNKKKTWATLGFDQKGWA